MNIGILREHNEPRVALVPSIVKKFKSYPAVNVLVEKNVSDIFTDEEYSVAGALIYSRKEILKEADIIFRLNAPDVKDINAMKEGSLSVSHMDPYNNKKLIDAFNDSKVNSISMEMIPRSTLAQKMDSLSSQSSLAGYQAVILGAYHLNGILPMMMTPSGTIAPAKVFIIGAGVAGLQAIATAKRLGARVEAFDTRSVVEEQVQSLGAKFIKIDLGEVGQTKDGYSKELTEEQLKKQQELIEKSCISADLIITTAKLFGRKAPTIITDKILENMKDGSVIVDLAADTGGNVEGTTPDKVSKVHGVTLVGTTNLAGMVAEDASDMYANNLYNLFSHFYDKEEEVFTYDLGDEILSSCLINHDGEVINDRIKEFWGY